MKMICAFLTCSIIGLSGFCLSARAQKSPNDDYRDRQRQESDLAKRVKAMSDLSETPRPNRNARAASTAPMSKEDRAKIEVILAPSAEDREKYKNFLKQKNTGLFRLFPDFNCVEKNIIKADGDCANFVPGSGRYSFRLNDYANEDFFDLKLSNGKLLTTGFMTQGILVRLGDAPLESIAPTSDTVGFLLNFVPEVEYEKVRKQYAEIAKGIAAADGRRYAKVVTADANTTYALRVVAYRGRKVSRFVAENTTLEYLKYVHLNDSDKRIDITVAFRIVRREPDGSVTILWKELKRQEAPKIAFAKEENTSGAQSNESQTSRRRAGLISEKLKFSAKPNAAFDNAEKLA